MEDSSREEGEDRIVLEGMSAKLSVTPVIKRDTSVTIAPSILGIKTKAKEERQ